MMGSSEWVREGLRKLMEADEDWISDFRSGCREYCRMHSAERFAKDVARICLGEGPNQ